MRDSTILHLNRLTHSLYQAENRSFNATRLQYWQGWKSCTPFFPNKAQLKILDLGCGNGRFARFSRENTPSTTEIEYWGIDNNQELLSHAIEQTSHLEKLTSSWKKIDLVEELVTEKLSDQLPKNYFDLILAFGILHHIPSLNLRQKFMTSIGEWCNKPGVCIVTFWQFGNEERFTSKQLNPSHFGIDPAELEPGDMLLPWGQNNQNARYCHASTKEEQQELIRTINLPVLSTFAADGKTGTLNQYYVLGSLATS